MVHEERLMLDASNNPYSQHYTCSKCHKVTIIKDLPVFGHIKCKYGCEGWLEFIKNRYEVAKT